MAGTLHHGAYLTYRREAFLYGNHQANLQYSTARLELDSSTREQPLMPLLLTINYTLLNRCEGPYS